MRRSKASLRRERERDAEWFRQYYASEPVEIILDEDTRLRLMLTAQRSGRGDAERGDPRRELGDELAQFQPEYDAAYNAAAAQRKAG